MLENEFVSFVFLCVVGGACYWFSLNVWIGSKRFRKGGKYVCSTVCTLLGYLRVSALCIGEARKVLND